MKEPIVYDVNYQVLDEFKRKALAAARRTARHLLKVGFKEVKGTRGESSYVIEDDRMGLAFVVEGLGTFGKIAEDFFKLTGKLRYANVMRANFATIMNDLTASGAYPLVANNFIAMGAESWLGDDHVRYELVRGWEEGCDEVGCAWGGGETQKLRDIVSKDSAVLAGAAMGIIKPKGRRIKGDVRPGDVIFIAPSTGLHANGATMARDTAASLPKGYRIRLPSGKTFGEALLDAPHALYGPLTQKALDRGIRIRYISNITGHGWRKLMRLDLPYTYRIRRLPKVHQEFRFIQKQTGVDDRTMFDTFNMGGGAAFMVRPKDADAFQRLAPDAIWAGIVEKGPRRVILEPLSLEWGSESYKAR